VSSRYNPDMMHFTKEEPETVRKAWKDLGEELVKAFRIDKITRWLDKKLTRKVE